MTIEVKFLFRDSKELAEFATWYDSRNDKPIDYTPTEKAAMIESVPTLPSEPVELAKPKAEPKAAPKAQAKPKAEPTTEAKEITSDEFSAAVKTWFMADAAARGPVVKKTLADLSVDKLTDVPADKYAAVLARLGVA